jgi:hypothetical protein
MADDRANNPARVVNTESIYKSLEGKKNIASVALPSRNDQRPGSGKWDFGGGRPHVEEYNEEELGPREMTKFDKNNKYHVGILTAKDGSNKGMMLHSGGYFSFPKKDASAQPKKKAAPKETAAPQVAGTAGAAKARAAALESNEVRMKRVRDDLAKKKNK